MKTKTQQKIRRVSRAIRNHFDAKTTPDKLKHLFRLTYKPENEFVAKALFNKLTNEDKRQFLQTYFRGVTTKHSTLEGSTISVTFNKPIGKCYLFSIYPKINAVNFLFDIGSFHHELTGEEKLHRIQLILPTVKAL